MTTKKEPRSKPRPQGDLGESILIEAPLVGNVSFGGSWERRRQTLAMFSCSLSFIIPTVGFCWALVLYCLYAHAYSATFMGCYLAWVFLLDRSPTTGTRRPIFRDGTIPFMPSWWQSACDYLPILLVKTAQLDPTQNYVMGYHPHGIISVGAFCALSTDGAKTLSLVKEDDDDETTTPSSNPNTTTGFSFLFPGIQRHVITLPQNFTTPFLREYFLSMGALNSSKETFRRALSEKYAGSQGGKALVVVVGGAAESLLVKPGEMDLVLGRRRGFIREAIMANASLVPVLGFGESNLYHVYNTEHTPWLVNVQAWVKRVTGFAMPIFRGRSVLLRDIGVMAERTPVVVVVGKPIAPPPASIMDAERRAAFRPSIDLQTDEALNDDGKLLKEWHAKYIHALEELHREHKDAMWNIPGRNRKKSLKIVR